MARNIFIQSISNDRSTDDVIDWISYLSEENVVPFFNKYHVDNFELSIENNNINFQINDTTLNYNDSFWYRRGKFTDTKTFTQYGVFSELAEKIHFENNTPFIEAIKGKFIKNNINKYQDNNLEKITMLLSCVDLKINIPSMIITNDKLKIKSFIKKHGKIITKPLKYPSTIVNVDNHKVEIITGTQLIENENIIDEIITFSPSLFQEYIEKKIELRSFYLNGKFKTMAIFSQMNEKTKIDFRNYDYSRPNRCIPYQLPKNIESKLNKLMKKLELNCGSFDIIYTPEGKYYFLEVNPIGQFQWLSYNCNFNIEKLIAQELINSNGTK